eukprot:4800433-Pyramimonas_sp.AAC.1
MPTSRAGLARSSAMNRKKYDILRHAIARIFDDCNKIIARTRPPTNVRQKWHCNLPQNTHVHTVLRDMADIPDMNAECTDNRKFLPPCTHHVRLRRWCFR